VVATVAASTSTIALDARMTLLVGENGSGKSTLLEAIALAAECRRPAPTTWPTIPPWTRCARSPRPCACRGRRAAAAVCSCAPRTTSATSSGTGRSRPRCAPRPSASPASPRTPSSSSASGAWRRSWGPRGPPTRATAATWTRARTASRSWRSSGRARRPRLYLLDEPEAALSPLRQLALVALLREATERGAQFVIATHAPILMAFPDATILQLTDDGVRPARFDDLEAVRTLRAFLSDPDGFVRRL
jgi:hypothetical protein